MAEKLATGDIDNDRKAIEGAIAVAKRGQILAFTLTLIAFAAAIVCFLRGSGLGLWFLAFPVAMLISSFVPHRWPHDARSWTPWTHPRS